MTTVQRAHDARGWWCLADADDASDGAGAIHGADATKKWVDAKIAIAPNATNEVGAPHMFTVTLMKDTGDGAVRGGAGEHVDVTLTDSSGAAHSARVGHVHDGGCEHGRVGQCTITFTSNTAGQGDGACDVDAVGGRLSSVHGRDRWCGAELG